MHLLYTPGSNGPGAFSSIAFVLLLLVAIWGYFFPAKLFRCAAWCKAMIGRLKGK